MQEILINSAIGGFGISKESFSRLLELKCPGAIEEQENIDGINKDIDTSKWDRRCYNIPRDDAMFVKLFKDHGESMNGRFSELKLIRIPDGIKWNIYENEDGTEIIREQHRTWE